MPLTIDPGRLILTRSNRPVTPTVFEALVDSIIEQQISLNAAHRIQYRLIRTAGTPLAIDGAVYYCYPAPVILAKTPDTRFRACGLTLRKGEYIRHISEQIVSGSLDPEHFRTYRDTEEIIREMVKIRGVGRWTAEIPLLRGPHRMDAFPADEIGVRRFISRFFKDGKKIFAENARAFAGRWGRWKGLQRTIRKSPISWGSVPTRQQE